MGFFANLLAALGIGAANTGSQACVFFYIDELIEYFGITDADLIEKLSNIKIETIEGLNFIVIK